MTVLGGTPPGGTGSGKGGNPPATPSNINLASSTASINAETEALLPNTKALDQNEGARERLGRLQKQKIPETFLEYLKRETEELQKATVAMGQYRQYVGQSFEAVKGFMTEMQNMNSLTAIYTRTLNQLEHSTQTYTSSMQANTDNMGQATEQADRFFEGTRAAAAEAENLAATYKMSSEEINAASRTAQKMFATQLGAMDDVGQGMKDLQKNSIVLGRYLGVDQKEVMESWRERMEASNMTLEDAQQETAMLTKVTDQYTKELTSLSGEMLKTAKIGKKEMFEATKAINNEFKIGVPNVVAYTNAMAKMAVQAAKFGGTKNEQKDAMEGVLRLGKSLTTVKGEFGLMGMLASEKLYAQFKTAPETLSKGLRERFSARASMMEGAPDIMKRQYAMETAGGSKEFTRLAFAELAAKGSGNVDQLAAQIQEVAGGSAITARMLASATLSKDEKSFDKAFSELEESNKTEAQKQLDKVEETVKNGAKTNTLLGNVVSELQKIQKYMMYMAVGSPILSALAGPLAGKLLGGVLGLGTKVLAGGAVTSATSTTAAGTIVTGGSTAAATGAGALAAIKAAAAAAAVPAALAAGAAAVGYVGYKAFKAHEGDKEDEASGRRARGGAKFSKWLTGQDSVDLNNVVMNMSWEELANRKKMIVELKKDVTRLKSLGDKMTEVDKKELELREEKLAKIQKSIKAITDAEAKEKAFTDQELNARHEATVAETVKRGFANLDVRGGTQGMVASFLSGQGQDVMRGDFAGNIAAALEGSEGKALKEKLGEVGFKEFTTALNKETMIKQMGIATYAEEARVRRGSNTQIAEEWGKRGRGAASTIIGFTDEERKAVNKGTKLSISAAAGDDGSIAIPTVDANGTMTIAMPSQFLRINGNAMSTQMSDLQNTNSKPGL
ncbi:MAG: hypothetical protein WC505_06940 [Patescibacteria group bacterium]